MFNIRLANENDIIKVFELSNDDVVRTNSIKKNKIEWEDHINWFNNRIKKVEEPFYIIENEKEDFIAQVRFNKENEGFVISISIQKDFRGKGLASKIIAETCKKIIDLYSLPVIALIKPKNTASKKSFLKAGFLKIQDIKINNEYYEKYILN